MSPRPTTVSCAPLTSGLVLLLAGLVLVGCTRIEVPTPPPDRAAGQEVGPPPGPENDARVPLWYGDTFDAAGCPVPRSGAAIVATSDSTLLRGVASDRGWCVYRGTATTTFFIIPPTADSDFARQVRESLQPLGWGFESADAATPQWSWVTAVPDAAYAVGFEEGAVDGALFSRDMLTSDDVGMFRIWFVPLLDAFGEWQAGDPAYILGLW